MDARSADSSSTLTLASSSTCVSAAATVMSSAWSETDASRWENCRIVRETQPRPGADGDQRCSSRRVVKVQRDAAGEGEGMACVEWLEAAACGHRVEGRTPVHQHDRREAGGVEGSVWAPATIGTRNTTTAARRRFCARWCNTAALQYV